MGRISHVYLSLIAVGVMGMALAACDTSAATSANPTFTPQSTANTATPTSSGCATAIHSPAPASGGPAFPDVSFPPGSVNSAFTPVHNDPGRWMISLANFCSPGVTAAAVKSFFATNLPSQGWTTSLTLPFDGGYQQACGDPYCWAKDTAPRYLGLEAVTDDGKGNVTYKIREFIPPAPASCDPTFGGPPYLLTGNGDIPLPPLTVNGGPGDGYSTPTLNHSYSIYCSAGTVTTIQSFFASALPKAGFVNGGTIPCVSGAGWVKGKVRVTVSISNATGWQEYTDICK